MLVNYSPGAPEGTPPRGHVVAEVVREYFECVNTESWSALRGLFHASVDLRAVGTIPRLGIDAAMEYFARAFEPWPRHYDEPRRLVGVGNVAVVEVTFTGETTTGRQLTFDAVDIFDLSEGRIARFSSWYDIALVRDMMR